MKRKYLIFTAIFSFTVAMAAWTVNYDYDSSAEGVNVRNIQAMGYHNIMQQGKVYKFQFKDGTVAYFMKLNPFLSYKFQQVSEADYEENPGAEPGVTLNNFEPDRMNISGLDDDNFEETWAETEQLTFPPNAVVIINGSGGRGVVTCMPACTG